MYYEPIKPVCEDLVRLNQQWKCQRKSALYFSCGWTLKIYTLWSVH